MKGKIKLILFLFCFICCILPSLGLGIYINFFKDEEDGSCVSPSDTTNYTVNVVNLKKGEFNVEAGCKSGFSGTASATECNASGGEYILSGCDPDASNSSPKNCSSTFEDSEKDVTYNLIDGIEITNFTINSLKTLNSEKKCSGTEENVSCNWDINVSGVINCSGSSEPGNILCSSSGIFELRNCSGVHTVSPAHQTPENTVSSAVPCDSDSDSSLDKIFKEFDVDGNDQIDAAEVKKKAAKGRGLWPGTSWSVTGTAGDVVEEIDGDKDGMIEKGELNQWYISHEQIAAGVLPVSSGHAEPLFEAVKSHVKTSEAKLSLIRRSGVCKEGGVDDDEWGNYVANRGPHNCVDIAGRDECKELNNNTYAMQDKIFDENGYWMPWYKKLYEDYFNEIVCGNIQESAYPLGMGRGLCCHSCPTSEDPPPASFNEEFLKIGANVMSPMITLLGTSTGSRHLPQADGGENSGDETLNNYSGVIVAESYGGGADRNQECLEGGDENIQLEGEDRCANFGAPKENRHLPVPRVDGVAFKQDPTNNKYIIRYDLGKGPLSGMDLGPLSDMGLSSRYWFGEANEITPCCPTSTSNYRYDCCQKRPT